ncbi:unnamed protein product [Miscanthus lutarioriparius]|uniref:Uncharacterized protein n=1 Tax=Miscanthus lutarioriparius TaxID=422564 RepID=A0A811RL87_9POAL|nr:unnamed protein product [Miscanthus lutarioriparius]
MAMEARRTGGAESGQDRTESSKKWIGGQSGDEDDGNESGRPTQMKKTRKLGGGERERSHFSEWGDGRVDATGIRNAGARRSTAPPRMIATRRRRLKEVGREDEEGFGD